MFSVTFKLKKKLLRKVTFKQILKRAYLCNALSLNKSIQRYIQYFYARKKTLVENRLSLVEIFRTEGQKNGGVLPQ